MSIFTTFLNPINWVKAYSFHKKNSKFDKSKFDLELFLYSKILKNDMLHYGYFEDVNTRPETISFEQFENAQIKYSENIIDQINNSNAPILDVGCGMGGLANLLLQKNMQVDVLTPNRNQIEYINHKYPSLTSFNMKFEEFSSTQKYGTIINSESLQYIDLDKAIEGVDKHLMEDGRWIVVDYFRLHNKGIEKSGKFLDDFRKKLDAKKWKVVYEQDITQNVLPTLAYLNMYVDRFLVPLKHFGFEKLRYKKAWLYYMIQNLKGKIDKKMVKELAAINVEKFKNEKKYILFVIEKHA